MAEPVGLTEAQIQLVLGTMLGDSNMRPTTKAATKWQLRINHGWSQHAYNSEKSRILSSLGSPEPEKVPNGGYGDWLSALRVPTTPLLAEWGKLCCMQQPNGRWKKIVTRRWLDKLSWSGIAWWLADDGSLNRKGRYITFHTEGFPRDQVELLVAWLKEMGIDCGVLPVWNRLRTKRYYRICCTTEGTETLIRMVSDCFPQTMRYKIDLPAPPPQGATCTNCKGVFRQSKAGATRSAKDPNRRVYCPKPACQTVKNEAYFLTRMAPEIEAKLDEATKADPILLASAIRRECRRQERDKINADKRARRARNRAARPKTFTCLRCQETFPKLRPGAKPKYCEPCRTIVDAEKNHARYLATKAASNSSSSPPISVPLEIPAPGLSTFPATTI